MPIVSPVEIGDQISDLQADEAERELDRLYRDAIRQGWTSDELRKVGLEPTNKTAAPKRRRTAPSSAV